VGSDGRFFGLELEWIIENPTGGIQQKFHFFPFDPMVEGWQYQMHTFYIPDRASNFTLNGVFQGEGTAYFDHTQLYHDRIGSEYGWPFDFK